LLINAGYSSSTDAAPYKPVQCGVHGRALTHVKDREYGLICVTCLESHLPFSLSYGRVFGILEGLLRLGIAILRKIVLLYN
jgi:hypothetical protein